MKNQIFRILTVLLCMSPTSLLALGLGPIQLLSGLNQPLNAQIPIISASEDELASLKVTLADDEAFQKAGIAREFLLTSIRFKLVQDAPKPYILMSTHKSIQEPSLTVLVDFVWPTGHRIQQYPLLLDIIGK